MRLLRHFRYLRYLYQDALRPIAPAPHHPEPALWSPDRITAAWLGHATVLLNFYGLTILTDPVFFARCGVSLGGWTVGPKRYIRCALEPREIPPIDLVLLSHAHMDHLDIRSLRRVRREAVVVTAEHTADVFRRLRFRDVRELAWESETRVETAQGGITVAAHQLRHWGARLQWDEHRRYNAYLLERGGRRLCFTGDTARTDGSALGRRGPIDLMMVPIAAYHPWIGSHCTPEEAVAMADEAGARFLLPIHHETFKLSWEPLTEPIARFRAALASDPQRLALAEVGETFVLPQQG